MYVCARAKASTYSDIIFKSAREISKYHFGHVSTPPSTSLSFSPNLRDPIHGDAVTSVKEIIMSIWPTSWTIL